MYLDALRVEFRVLGVTVMLFFYLFWLGLDVVPLKCGGALLLVAVLGVGGAFLRIALLEVGGALLLLAVLGVSGALLLTTMLAYKQSKVSTVII